MWERLRALFDAARCASSCRRVGYGLKEFEEISDDDAEGDGVGREEGRRAAGEDSGGKADDEDDGEGSRVEVEDVEGEEAQLFLTPHTGRAVSLLPSITPEEYTSTLERQFWWWLS